VGAGVSVGDGVQVGMALSHTLVGDGPGVAVGGGVLLGVADMSSVGVSVSCTVSVGGTIGSLSLLT